MELMSSSETLVGLGPDGHCLRMFFFFIYIFFTIKYTGGLVPKYTEFESRASCTPSVLLFYLNRGQFISFDAIYYESAVKWTT
jgi:hypothetical protein